MYNINWVRFEWCERTIGILTDTSGAGEIAAIENATIMNVEAPENQVE